MRSRLSLAEKKIKSKSLSPSELSQISFFFFFCAGLITSQSKGVELSTQLDLLGGLRRRVTPYNMLS